ncbi:MAG: serine/threonine protein kinase, partial [Planctomycetaceae bacterium]|nr:serine/threonine protein kinase [Planctomycetaceae bacterium]
MNERDLFIAARQLDSVEKRRAFLTKACGADAQLHARVNELLQAEEQAGSFLQQPAIAIASVAGCASDGTARTQLEGESVAGEAATVSLDFLAPSRLPGSLGCMGQYEITEFVGSGGMGIVLKANDPKLNRVVAVKVLAPELGRNATARRRFMREGQAAAAIAHPHIVTIFAVDEDLLPYLVMEYVDGVSLQEKIDRDGVLELKETLRIGTQIAAGLSAAHTQGVIHRDIKPANILLENGVERVRITDFGLARAVDDVAVTRAGEVAGTPQYMSPEQAQGLPVDARSDLFSLGCVLYAMCTGRSPFRAESSIASLRRVCDDTPRPIQEVNLDTPEWLSAIISQLLEKLPEDRIQTAAEVADLLNQHLAHLQNPSVTPSPQKLVPRRRRRTVT